MALPPVNTLFILNTDHTRAAVPVSFGFACYHVHVFEGHEWIGFHAGLVCDEATANRWVAGEDDVAITDVYGVPPQRCVPAGCDCDTPGQDVLEHAHDCDWRRTHEERGGWSDVCK